MDVNNTNPEIINDSQMPEPTTPEPTKAPEPIVPPVPGTEIKGDDKKPITAEDILKLKEEWEEARQREIKALAEKADEEIKLLREEIERQHKSQMDEETRRAYEAKQKAEKEIEERNQLIEENKRLKAEKERQENQAYIQRQFAKYPFIDSKYHGSFQTKEQFDAFFTPKVIEDFRDLAIFKEQQEKHSRNVIPGNVAVDGNPTGKHPNEELLATIKNKYLNK